MKQTPMYLTEEEFLLFQKILVDESGLYFGKDKIKTLEPVLNDRLKQHGCLTYTEYYDFLKSCPKGPKEIRVLFDLLTIGETFFFRGAPHFEALNKSVLPEIIRRKIKRSQKSLRLWSAGCSKGDEPYSLAIAIMEALPDWRDWDISILGTDINRQVLSFAREGIYTMRDVMEIPSGYVNKYFKVSDAGYVLNEEVKKLVRFQDHNLARDSFFNEGMQNCDIIFCRNVTIYFDFPTTQKIIDKFYDCLIEEGYLFIGYAETLWQITDKFQVVEFPQAFIYKKPVLGSQPEAVRPFMSVPAIEVESLLSESYTEQPQNKEMPPVDSLSHLERANALANEGQYPEAIRELEEILNCDNLCAEAYYLLGVLKYRTGDMKEAQAQFKKVIYIDPTIILAYYNLGSIYLYQRKFSSAQREFRNAIKILMLRPAQEKVRLSEDYTVEFLIRACQSNLEEIERQHNGC